MTLSARFATVAFASLLLTGAAFAQSAAPAPAKTDTPAATTTAAPTDKKMHSAASLECSKEADDKGLKGKERKKFRRECKKKGGAAKM